MRGHSPEKTTWRVKETCGAVTKREFEYKCSESLQEKKIFRKTSVNFNFKSTAGDYLGLNVSDAMEGEKEWTIGSILKISASYVSRAE